MDEAMRGITWSKVGVRKLKGIRRNDGKGISPICNKERNRSHIPRCEGTKIWRDQTLDKRFRNIDAEIFIRNSNQREMK
jgi:hypothetical protein